MVARESDGPGVERNSHVALYAQIAERLRREIEGGRYAPTGRLPTEKELMARFEVSRITIRQALQRLLEGGLVVRKQGKGSFVAGSTVRHELRELRTFYDVMESQGLEPETELLRFEPVTPSPEVAAAMGAPAGKLMFLERLYRIDGAPIAVAHTWLIADARRITWEQAEANPSYSILQSLLGRAIAQASVAVRGRLAGRAIARLLGVSPKSAVLVLNRVSYDAQGAPLETTAFVVNSDTYEFTLESQGPLPINRALKASQAA